MTMMMLKADDIDEDPVALRQTGGSSPDGGLPLFSFQLQQNYVEPSGALTPPLQTRVASVPFQWEEAPGRPRLKPKDQDMEEEEHNIMLMMRSLDLPPRLSSTRSSTSTRPSFSGFTPSLTTVLDGPAGMMKKRSLSGTWTSSFRKMKSTTTKVGMSGRRVASDAVDDQLLGASSPSSHFMVSIFQGLKQAVVAPWRSKCRQVADRRQDQHH